MNLKYAPNLQIGDLILITDGNYLEEGIVSSFTKTNKPRYIRLASWYVANFNTTKYLENIILKRWVVKIDKSLISIEQQKIYEDLKQLILNK
jgi:hypothetical protein